MLCARHVVEEWLSKRVLYPWPPGTNQAVPAKMSDAARDDLISRIDARDAALIHYNVEDVVRKPPPCPRCEEEER